MRNKKWFAVSNSIVDREDLTINEKMCLVVLSRYAGKEEFESYLTSDIIALKMGISVLEAKNTIFKLIEKKLIDFEEVVSETTVDRQSKKIIKSEQILDIETIEFEKTVDFDDENEDFNEIVYKKQDIHDMIDELYNIIDERISEREAKIILNFANNNLEKIRQKYDILKINNSIDIIDDLIEELQRKDISNLSVFKAKSQVNFANINKLKAYSKFSKK